MSKNVNTIKDNNVDYDNNSIPAMRQRIAELEVENKNCKLRYELAGAEEEIRRLREENAKLQEQLKNVMKIPDEIMNFIIDCTFVGQLDYNNINDYVKKLKAEAQKYLEEHK